MIKGFLLGAGAAHGDEADVWAAVGDEGRPELAANQADDLEARFGGTEGGDFEPVFVLPDRLGLPEVKAVLGAIGGGLGRIELERHSGIKIGYFWYDSSTFFGAKCADEVNSGRTSLSTAREENFSACLGAAVR